MYMKSIANESTVQLVDADDVVVVVLGADVVPLGPLAPTSLSSPKIIF